MYEAFYGLKEKPFSLLPDPAFLYFSKKHRMAFTMLEYGLANQAGFTVISGGIGTGKTTLIRHLLNNMAQDTTVGLISNTHQSFGELLQWILLAFDLEHAGKDKVEMYQAFVDFMIDEYARGRRTVLIVDEAQNMSPETLEELRMLSNVNADKDQVLQVILVGQEELRATLRRPELTQFAQRIAVDYQLTPLTAEDTRGLIRHRLEVAGGSPALFTEGACQVVHHYSGGTPRLVNLLCDLALVYGFAEQRERIDAALMNEVALEKQAGGIFPAADPLNELPPDDPAAAGEETASPLPDGESLPRAGALSKTDRPAPQGEGCAAEGPDPALLPEQPLRIALAGESAELRRHLRELVAPYRIEVAAELALDALAGEQLDPAGIDLLLIDMDDDNEACTGALCDLIGDWNIPVLFNDSQLTRASLEGREPGFGNKLVAKLLSLLQPEGTTPTTRHSESA
ncbi:AAA family ATPase [Thiohalobacter sp. IOR34]|uniref:ExeA family protein n=1 Tax=Thiohalobacter sp. IOR34 TaxID=3057176 RepID=UPI0025B00859|nr:AAA family ATPase [Thiohalobacter sp. IOR34]WJW75215.1 AAA family ATPase [Thiohalobacter sp. IOR34]